MTAHQDIQPLPPDRILVLAPHPDDESIACAGVIQQAVKRKIPVRVVFLTYGDVNEWSFLGEVPLDRVSWRVLELGPPR